MKITLSKSQWEEVGRTAGWLNKPICKKCEKPLKLNKNKQCVNCGTEHKELQQELPIRIPDEKKPITNTNPLGNPNYKGVSKIDFSKPLPKIR